MTNGSNVQKKSKFINIYFLFSFSPFSTHSIANDHCYTLPYYEFNHDNFNTNKDEKSNSENNQEMNNEQINISKEQITRCVIDKNLDKALLDESTDLIALEHLLQTPPSEYTFLVLLVLETIFLLQTIFTNKLKKNTRFAKCI